MAAPRTHDPRPTRARRIPPWWAILLVQAAGLWFAGTCLAFAFFSIPEYGLFGVANDPGTRRAGGLAALAVGPALLSGPLFVGLVRRDRRWLVPTAWIAGIVSLLLLVTGLGA